MVLMDVIGMPLIRPAPFGRSAFFCSQAAEGNGMRAGTAASSRVSYPGAGVLGRTASYRTGACTQARS